MLAVIATLTVQADKAAAFEAAFRSLAQAVKASEPDCTAYQLASSREEPGLYKVLEIYASPEAFKAHGRREHFRAAWPGIAACLAGDPRVEVLDALP